MTLPSLKRLRLPAIGQALHGLRNLKPVGAADEVFPAWLPYGSTDASVILRDALTSDPTGRVQANHGLTAVVKGDAAGPAFDPVLGMRGSTAADASVGSCLRINFTAGQYAALTTAGQISFEIQTGFLCEEAAQSHGSNGDTVAATSIPLGFTNTSNNGTCRIDLLRRLLGSNQQVGTLVYNSATDATYNETFLGWAAAAVVSGKLHTHGKPANGFTRVNVGWYTDGADKRVVTAIDGLVFQTATRSDTTNNPFMALILGARGNYGGGSELTPQEYCKSHYIRNVQVSTQAPVVPTLASGELANIAILSDSIISAATVATSPFDLMVVARIHRKIETLGIRPASIYRMQAAGHLMTELADGAATYSFTAGTVTGQVVSAGSTSTDPRGTVKALDPTTIVINGGSNDVGTGAVTAELFRAAIKDHIEFFCGLNGYAAPGVMPSRIWITNICDRGTNWDAAARAKAAEFRIAIDEIPGWFLSAYPSETTRIAVIDTFNGMGGTGSYTGKISADEVHPDYAGVYRLGETIGAALAAAGD